MDRKVPKTMALRNKNAPKVPESGTPEVGNQLVRTERRAHVEIILSKTGKNLLQTPDSFCKSALFLPFSIWHFWPDHISAHRQKNRPTWELCPWWAVNWLLSLDAQLLKIAVIP